MRAFFVPLIMVVCLCLIPQNVLYAMSDTEAPEHVYHPQIKETSGPVMLMGVKHGIWEPAGAGMLLLAGDVLRTGKGAHRGVIGGIDVSMAVNNVKSFCHEKQLYLSGHLLSRQ